MEIKDKKIALVHDFLTGLGGAERVLVALCEMFPEAPIYTLLYDKKAMRGKFSDRTIKTSYLQNLPKFLHKRKKWLLPLMPVAPEIFDLRDFDLVISSSGAWSKGIVTRLNTTHISYIHSPMRFAWDAKDEYLRQQKNNRITGLCAKFVLNYMRVWDRTAADRPDFLIANSEYTQKRIKRYYGRESDIIYPPVKMELNIEEEAAKSNKSQDEKYFLVVSRLSAYKKIDVVVEAFNKLELPSVVIGCGQQERYLRSIAEKNVKILGYRSDEEVSNYYKGARAFIFAGVDDFGISSVEAMLHGVPVLAIRGGGVKEIVIEGKTGEFFDVATPEVIADGVRRLMENEEKYSKGEILRRGKEFSQDKFIMEMERYVEKVLAIGKTNLL